MEGSASTTQVPGIARELVAALRPHFFALPVLAALAGMATAPGPPRLGVRPVSCLFIAALGWGGAQLINDWFDRETDAINAPDRAIVSGRLPVRHALAVAGILGVGLMIGSAALHPSAWVLSIAGVVLVLSYNFTKRTPLAGNLALAALVAVTTALGLASELPTRGPDAAMTSLLAAISQAHRTLLLTGGIAAWYLQSNYEKDRVGDEAAGYRTLAVVVGVRASALVRAAGMVVIIVFANTTPALATPFARVVMGAAGIIGLYSSIAPALRDSEEAALRAYRPVVMGSMLAMGALSAGANPILLSAILVLALATTEAAFRRSRNP